MKNVKLFWKSYQKSGLENWISPANIWRNTSNSSAACDYTIHFDSLDVPNSESIFLVEPKSIHPKYYEYAKKHYGRLKSVISYDRSFFRDIPNLIHIPPPFGAWMHGDDRKIHKKNKNISFIASTKEMCEEHVYRQQMVKKFVSHCDVYGSGRGAKEIKHKIDGLRDYRFTFCMENYVTDLYYTEKLLDCFLTGTIPIFYGVRNINTVFDDRGVVWMDDILRGIVSIEELDEEFYKSRLEYINHNFNVAKSLNNGVPNSIDHAIINGLK